MRSGGRHREHWRASAFLMASEVAVAVAVMAGAALLVRSFSILSRVDPGFRREGVLVVQLPLAADWEKSWQLFETRIRPGLTALPGVESVAAANSVPMSLGPTEHTRFATRFGVVGRHFDPGRFPTTQTRWVTEDYFRVLGIPLKSGRLLTQADHNKPRYVINETLARRFFPHQNAVGRKLLLGVVSPNPEPQEIIGVVGDVREFGLDRDPEPVMYGIDVSPEMAVLVRSSIDPALLANAVARTIHGVDSEMAIGTTSTMEEYVQASLARQRFALVLLSVFAGLGAFLSAIGIHGVIGYSVSRRLREFGIRAAVGARPGDLLAMVLREAAAVAFAGSLAGLALAFGFSRLMKTLLYGIPANDAMSWGGAVFLVASLCAVSALFPAKRAAAADPASVLREE